MAEWDRVRQINERFWNGKPSNDLAEAGLLVRQFDGLDDMDHGKRWLPCPKGAWCGGLRDRWAATIINKDVNALYYGTDSVGGLILEADVVKLNCAYPEDGNSMAPSKICGTIGGDGTTCIPGCSPVGEQCHEVGHLYSCSFPPHKLKDALEGQKTLHGAHDTHGGYRNNEVVVDLIDFTERLPAGIAGFFFMKNNEHDKQEIQKAHRDFISQYKFPRQAAPPLMSLDLNCGCDQPFTLVPAEYEWGPGAG